MSIVVCSACVHGRDLLHAGLVEECLPPFEARCTLSLLSVGLISARFCRVDNVFHLLLWCRIARVSTHAPFQVALTGRGRAAVVLVGWGELRLPDVVLVSKSIYHLPRLDPALDAQPPHIMFVHHAHRSGQRRRKDVGIVAVVLQVLSLKLKHLSTSSKRDRLLLQSPTRIRCGEGGLQRFGRGGCVVGERHLRLRWCAAEIGRSFHEIIPRIVWVVTGVLSASRIRQHTLSLEMKKRMRPSQ